MLKQIERFRDEFDIVTVGYGEAPDGVVEHLRIPDDAPAWQWPRAALIMRHYRRAYWGNPAVAAARMMLARPRASIDLALANDVDTVPLVMSVVDPCMVHVDLHEYAPRQREELPRWRIFVSPFLSWILRTFVTRAASTSTVSSGLARAYKVEFGLAPTVVTNATPYREAEPTPVNDPIRLVHSGAALPNRALELMIDAVETTSTSVSLDLYLTANDPAYREVLRQRCATSKRSRLNDPVPYSQLIDTLARYDLGVFVLPPTTFNYRWALPNKLFDYVQARLGVVVGPSPEMAGIVEQHGLGVVCGDFTAESLRRALDGLEPGRVWQMKSAAHRAAASLSASFEIEKWASAIADIVGARRS
ncbi:glycosyltransferase family 1 protein [Microcella sp.]|uniref:glycosyltransferase family 1 protein n=1 Tax=Microcella sp. TaxID=1913979 RepID=UPI00391D891C